MTRECFGETMIYDQRHHLRFDLVNSQTGVTKDIRFSSRAPFNRLSVGDHVDLGNLVELPDRTFGVVRKVTHRFSGCGTSFWQATIVDLEEVAVDAN